MAEISEQDSKRVAECLTDLTADSNGERLLDRWGRENLERLLLASQFAQLRFQSDRDGLVAWLDCAPEEFCDPERIRTAFAPLKHLSRDAAAVALRQYRQRVLVGIAFADIALGASLESVLLALSVTADSATEVALAVCTHEIESKYGRILDSAGQPIMLGVLAMGKLGGGELNFSSDIDVVFVFRANGESDGPRSLAAEAYFTRLAQRFIRLLDELTADGFVYRVDARLRPFGDSGPLVVSVDALETYLAVHGRDWERYAYLKARLISGDPELAEELQPLLQNFVFRRYLDYGVFESLREMKAMIAEEVARKSMAANIKRGPGGIREIEFIVQSLQLVRGGADAELRSANLLNALTALRAANWLSGEAAERLASAYRFLRRLENRLQADRDQQTHDLPGAPADLHRLALAMGFEQASQLSDELSSHRAAVSAQFVDAIVRSAEAPPSQAVVWGSDAAAIASSMERPEGDRLCQELADFHRVVVRRKLQPQALDRLQRLMPKLTEVLIRESAPTQFWRRLRPVLETVTRRSAYLSLLIENPPALQRFVSLAGGHPYLADELVRNPALLDELLDERIIDDTGTDGLVAERDTTLVKANPDDPESVILALIEFQRSASFRTAVADVRGELGVMKVADRLTRIAELVVQDTLALAWAEAVARYGLPAGACESEPALCVVAYGKLGGLELGYSSDLDLVFLHDLDPSGATTGRRPIATEVFFQRLVRKLTHLLTYQTRLGPLYEVDIRLRPSGRSGMLVTTTDAFARYQREDAWTWEHQALVRARAVAGNKRVADKFAAVRVATLRNEVRRDSLRAEVQKMRARMHKELVRAGAGQFDLKQSRGGLADLEFLVQYLVLDNADRQPDVLTYSDNVRQLEALKRSGILDEQAAADLTEAYLTLRALVNQQTLAGQAGPVRLEACTPPAARVVRHWDHWLGRANPDSPTMAEV